MIKLVLTQAEARIVDQLLGAEQTKLRKSASSNRELASKTREDYRRDCEHRAVVMDRKADAIAAIRCKVGLG